MEKLLTVEEVAAYLRINRETVVRKARKGEIPAVKIGYRSYRFHKEQIDEWLMRQTVKEAKAEEAKPAKRGKLNLKAYPMGITGGLRRRDIYEE